MGELPHFRLVQALYALLKVADKWCTLLQAAGRGGSLNSGTMFGGSSVFSANSVPDMPIGRRTAHQLSRHRLALDPEWATEVPPETPTSSTFCRRKSLPTSGLSCYIFDKYIYQKFRFIIRSMVRRNRHHG